LEHSIEQKNKNFQLAAGYAVLLRRDGYSDSEIKLLLQDTYQLSAVEADKAWEQSLKQHAATHRKISRETVVNTGGAFLITVIILLFYGFIWNGINNYVAIAFYLFAGLALLGTILFIQQYLSLSIGRTLKSDISENNKLAAIAPVLVMMTLLFAGMYLFHANEVLEKDGNWIKNVTIEKYGERGSTGGKSPSYFTILRIEKYEQPFRYFDNEEQFSLLPIDSLSLKPGQKIDIFVYDRSIFSFHGYRDEIINISQNNRKLTSLEHRNKLVYESNKKRLLYFSIITILYILICIYYGRYLFHKKVLAPKLT
jgi:hypothetical protein